MFNCSSMKVLVKRMVNECDECKQAKSERIAYPGLLQHLLTLKGIWRNITRDSIEGLLLL